MKILLWHGYLLGGTGSNVYTRALARAWSRLGHEVTVFCQEPHPDRFDLAGARVVRPEIDGPLPVFVLDRYEDSDPRLLQDLSATEREHFVERNAAALLEHMPADFVFTNHLLLGGPVGAASGMTYTVKAHGSELEFSMRGNDVLCAWACDSLSRARVILAGSEHIRTVIEEVLGAGDHLGRIGIVPPGVDVEHLKPEARDVALQTLVEEARQDRRNPDNANERLPDEGNADRLAEFLSGDRPTALYVGKLSHEKGVALLLDAIRELEVRTVIVGFGESRAQLERAAGPDVLFTGALEHRHLAHLWPLADVSVMPSIFPEAFGMVAAEAAACGSPPLVARHSGLAEIASGLEEEYPASYGRLTSFESGNVDDLRMKLTSILDLPRGDWLELSEAARRAAVARWSWEHVAAAILPS